MGSNPTRKTRVEVSVRVRSATRLMTPCCGLMAEFSSFFLMVQWLARGVLGAEMLVRIQLGKQSVRQVVKSSDFRSDIHGFESRTDYLFYLSRLFLNFLILFFLTLRLLNHFSFVFSLLLLAFLLKVFLADITLPACKI